MLDLQLWAFAPGAAEATILPQPLSVSASTVLSAAGAMSITYPLGAPGAELLDGYCDVELRYLDGDAWACPPNGRFTVQDWQTDPVGEANMATRTYTLVSWDYLLDSARQFDVSALDSAGMREFINATPMSVVETLIGEAQADGFAPTLTVDQQATTTGWAPPYRPGDSVAQILSDARDSGFGEWLFQPDGSGCGRKLTLYDAVGTDLSTGDDPVQVQWTGLGEVTAAPSKRTARGMATDVLVQGEDGAFVKLHNADADAPFGRTQTYISAAGIKDTDQLEAIGQAVLDGGAAPAVQLTRTVDLAGSRWLPFVDYNLGDTILGPDETGAQAPLRVREIAVSLEGERWTATLVLGDKLSERLLDLNRRVRKMQAPYVLGRGAATPAPPIQDNTTPPVSSALTATPKLGMVILTWNGKDEDGNDVAAGFDHAEAERDTSGSFANPVVVGRFNSAGELNDGPLAIGTTYYYRLVVVNAAGTRAAASSAVSVTVVGVKGPDLEANSVTANKMDVGSLDAISANLGTVTAGTINGIDINGSTITGSLFRTASSGKRLEISNSSGSGGAHGIGFVGSGNDGYLTFTDSSLTLRAPSTGVGNGTLTLSDSISLTGRGGASITVYGNSGGFSITDGSSFVNSSGISVTGSVSCSSATSSGDITGNRLAMTSPPSTSNAANVYYNSSNDLLYLSTSRSALKAFQKPIKAHYGLLDLPTKTWIDKGLRREIPGYDQRTAGMTVEDIEALSAQHDGAFDPLLSRDPVSGEAHGIAYDRITAYLLPVVADMHRRLTALEAHHAA